MNLEHINRVGKIGKTAYPRAKQIRATKIGRWWVKPEDLESFIKSRSNIQ